MHLISTANEETINYGVHTHGNLVYGRLVSVGIVPVECLFP